MSWTQEGGNGHTTLTNLTAAHDGHCWIAWHQQPAWRWVPSHRQSFCGSTKTRATATGELQVLCQATEQAKVGQDLNSALCPKETPHA